MKNRKRPARSGRRRPIPPEKTLARMAYNAEMMAHYAARQERVTRRDHFEYLTRLWHVFTSHMGLAHFRRVTELGDPRPDYDRALAVAREAAAVWAKAPPDRGEPSDESPWTSHGLWSEMPKERDAVPFPFGTAALVGLLVDDRFDTDLSKALPALSKWRRFVSWFPLNYRDAFLVAAIRTGRVPAGWAAYLDTAFGEPDDRLIHHTFSAYMGLIRALQRKDWAAARARVAELEEYLPLRTHDQFNDWDGLPQPGQAGPGFDFRLAAILGHFRSPALRREAP